MKWSDVAIVIPAMLPARAAFVEHLMLRIKAECPGAFLLICPHEEGTPARVDFPRALGEGVATGRPWVLQLEDDVELCPHFSVRALHGMDSLDQSVGVVTLFSRNKADLIAYAAGHFFRPLAPKSFSMSQGFFIRSELAAGVHRFAFGAAGGPFGWYQRHPQHNRAADLLLGAYLSERKARVLVRIPSLVQHRPGPSTLPGHHGARQSESYRRAFGEVA